MLSIFLQQVANGLTVGVVYSLIAIGLTLTFGILGVINFAHGEFYMLGAFVTFSLVPLLGLGYFASTGLAMVVVALLGLVSERLTIKPLRGRHMFTFVLSTLGLSIFLQNWAVIQWGPDPQEIAPAYAGKPVIIAGMIYLSQHRAFVFILGIVLIAAISVFMKWTKAGMAMRAVGRDKDTAALMGINVDRVYALTFAFGAGLAALAGSLLGALFNIEPSMGEWAIIKAFAVVIMGGMGSVPGAIFGGLILGVAENLGAGFLPGGPGYKDAIGYVILILVLLFRPQGLFGKRV